MTLMLYFDEKRGHTFFFNKYFMRKRPGSCDQ